jgi:hypothetical protein
MGIKETTAVSGVLVAVLAQAVVVALGQRAQTAQHQILAAMAVQVLLTLLLGLL